MKNILLRLAKADKNIVVLSSTAEQCGEFSKFFPERYFSFGRAEANMMSCAAGFALAGKTPIVVGNSKFLAMRAFDQIYNDICVPHLNVKIFAVKEEGETPQALEKALSSFPNLKIEKEGKQKTIEELMKEYCPAYITVDEL